MTQATTQSAAQALLPKSWSLAGEIVTSNTNEAHRLALYLLDKVHARTLEGYQLGIHNTSTDEEINFVAKLESVSRFALLAERYGLDFDLDKQAMAFLRNSDLSDLAVALGIQVSRADLPWALGVIGLDARLRQSHELPHEAMPLDILFSVATRSRDWYEETIGDGFASASRDRVIDAEEVQEFVRATLTQAYDTYIEEREAGVDDELAKEVVRRSLGQTAAVAR